MIRLLLAACFAVFAVSGFTQGTRLPDAASAAEAEVNNSTLAYRTWKDRTGHFSVVARFDKKLSDGRIRLRRKGDEKRIDINPDVLSDEDQKALITTEEQNKAKAEEELKQAEDKRLQSCTRGIREFVEAVWTKQQALDSLVFDENDTELTRQNKRREINNRFADAVNGLKMSWLFVVDDIVPDRGFRNYPDAIHIYGSTAFASAIDVDVTESRFWWTEGKELASARKGDLLLAIGKIQLNNPKAIKGCSCSFSVRCIKQPAFVRVTQLELLDSSPALLDDIQACFAELDREIENNPTSDLPARFGE